MAYTFAIDCGKLDTLSSELETTSTTVDTEITGVYTGIDSMGTADTWSGSSFDTFKEGAHQYEAALKTVPEVVKAFSTQFANLSTAGAETIKAIDSVIGSIQ